VLGGCHGGSEEDTGDTGDTGDTEDPYDGPTFIPVAVGFEYLGGWEDGALTGAFEGIGIESGPHVTLYFADVEFFTIPNRPQQHGHFCSVRSIIEDVEEMADPTAFPTYDDSVMWHAWDLALSVDPFWWNDRNNLDNCGDLVDPEEWGEDAQELMATFDGLHFGMGFGPMTAYLEASLAPEYVETYGSGMFAEYIAINDKDGVFVGRDWTTGTLYQWDEETHWVVYDEHGYAVVQAVSPAGSEPPPMPNGFINSFAYWYQDFPLMDFDNLQDGAPGE